MDGGSALQEAALGAAQTFHPDGSALPLYFEHRGRAELRAQRGKRPTCRIDHPHAAQPIDHDGGIGRIGAGGCCNVQNLAGAPQKVAHKPHIDQQQGFFRNYAPTGAGITPMVSWT